LAYFIAIWNTLWPFGTFCYKLPFSILGCCTTKNLATLSDPRRKKVKVKTELNRFSNKQKEKMYETSTQPDADLGNDVLRDVRRRPRAADEVAHCGRRTASHSRRANDPVASALGLPHGRGCRKIAHFGPGYKSFLLAKRPS
jgi:hypothetical protein